MRLLYLHLENYINIYHGLGRTSLDIDFSRCNHKILIILGQNGSGKSSIFKSISPFMDDSSVFIPDREVKKIITYALNDGTNLTISYSAYKGVNTRSKPTRCSIIRSYPNGESFELNENGNITSGKEIIFDLLDLNDDYVVLSSISATNKGLGDMTPSERKRYVGNILSAISEYSDMYKLFASKSLILKSLLKSITVKLSQIGSIEMVQNSIMTNEKSLKELLSKNDKLTNDIALLKANLSNIMKNNNSSNPVQDLHDSIERRKIIESKFNSIPKEYIEKYTEEYMIEITEKNAKLSSQYELLDERMKELVQQEESIQKSIESNKLKLDALNDKDIYTQTKKKIDDLIATTFVYQSKFTSLGFENYDNITETEYNLVLSSIERFNSIIDYIGDNFDQNIREKAVDSNWKLNTYDDVKHSLESELKELNKKHEDQVQCRDTLKKMTLIPEDCTKVSSCPFFKEYFYVKTVAMTEQEFDNLLSKLEEVKDSLERLDKYQIECKMVLACKEQYQNIISIISPILKSLSYFVPNITLEGLKYNIIHVVKIDLDISKYQEYSNYISIIQSSKEDIKRLQSELDRIGSNKESISIEVTLTKLYEDMETVLKNKNDVFLKLDNIKSEYFEVKNEYEKIKEAKEYKKQYNELSQEMNELQKKIDSLAENANQFKTISNELNSLQTEYDNLNSKDIPILQNSIEKAKYQMVLYDQYRHDYNEYQDKFDKLQSLKRYSSINGIQTIYMEVFMNSILQEANELLSLLFKGRFKLQPFEINENEFIIPCIDDNGNIRPDISLMSDSQLSEISMILSFVLLHKASQAYNIIKLDEVDDNLDNENRLQFSILINRVMELLNFEQCIIISHNNELDISNADVLITRIEDNEHRRSIINSGANIIADFT